MTHAIPIALPYPVVLLRKDSYTLWLENLLWESVLYEENHFIWLKKANKNPLSTSSSLVVKKAQI